MQLDECYELGYIIKPHGIQGDVRVFLDVDAPEDYLNMESVFVAEGSNLVPYFISSIRQMGDNMVVKFEDITSQEQARALQSKKLHLPLDMLPELDEDQFYYHEIVNFQIIDEAMGQLGKVKEIYLKGNQDLINMLYHDTEVLIPISDEIIRKIDRESRTLHVKLPDGLLDIYLS